MNFFKSVFSDEPDPPNPDSESESESEPESRKNPEQEDADSKSPPSQPDPNPSSNSGGWMFGDLIKTLATKSESVIETYRRDLQEFGSGLKKEIEVAQGSLETVGSVIDEFGNTVLKGTAQIISQGTDAILAPDHESDSSDPNNQSFSSQQGLNSKRYSRFDVQVRAIQGDAGTYCEEPEDLDEFNKWKSGFVLEDKSEEIEGLFEENGAMESIYKRVVPSSVDHETFWCRYFYRVYKLRQAEDVRANLVKRAISIEEDEELSWDVDDEEYDESVSNVVSKANSAKNTEGAASGKVEKVEDLKVDSEVGDKSSSNVGEVSSVGEEANVGSKKGDLAANRELVSKDSEQMNVKEESSSVEESQVAGTSSSVVDEKGGKSPEMDKEKKDSAVKLSGDKETEKKVIVEGDSGKKDLPSKSEEKVALEGKNEALESGDASVVSNRSSAPEEEDLGWDEIEDLSSIDEKKVTHVGSGSSNKADLRKRLSTAEEEEEEDLSWDIEDEDDEPAKP
ncbi:PREDICTED: BSD [Prunus dulcis]|uniref:PREDICTED: BSD n=2 Tax=Prunus dulcis TaxID=3755 RepID=A0A5E4EF47_PRUDU|nr:hypothetical protein L3X38_045212 [Prunus dulcis]VVA14042.1 PREDICTED: BSD [Prunus dulcis]